MLYNIFFTNNTDPKIQLQKWYYSYSKVALQSIYLLANTKSIELHNTKKPERSSRPLRQEY